MHHLMIYVVSLYQLHHWMGRCLWMICEECGSDCHILLQHFHGYSEGIVWWSRCGLRMELEPRISWMLSKRANHRVTTFGWFDLMLNRNTLLITCVFCKNYFGIYSHNEIRISEKKVISCRCKYNTCTGWQKCQMSYAVSLMTNQNCSVSE